MTLMVHPKNILLCCRAILNNTVTLKHGNSSFAIAAEERMGFLHVMNSFQPGIQPDSDTCASLLQACGHAKSLAEGKQVHAHMLVTGIQENVYLETNLMAMYSKCGSLVDASLVFDKMSKRNVFSWNSMIATCVRHRQCEEALTLFYQMQRVSVQPDNFTFPCVLRACANLSALQLGKEIHEYIITSGFESDVFVHNALIDMYVKCGSLSDARQVFDKMPQRDMVSWNAMIYGYTQGGYGNEALELLRQMQLAGMKPDSFTMVSALPSCAQLAALNKGREMHDYIIRSGFQSNAIVQSAVVAMYADCGSIDYARQIFDKMCQSDEVLWNAMIAGYSRSGNCEETLQLFREMQLEGMVPNSITIASVLPACAHLATLRQGEQIHAFVIRNGLVSNCIVGSALVTMYTKCGSLESAGHMFEKMSQRDVVSWNGMIAGYTQNGHCDDALKLFRQMQMTPVKPDFVTIASVLPSCSHLPALQQGKEIHDYVIRNGLDSHVLVANAVIDMYAKCGSIDDAGRVFKKMSQRDVISWTVIIAGYGMHGHGEDALTLFYRMQKSGMKPDLVTFTAVLSACSHAGLVDEGMQFFDLMSGYYCIVPGMEHYGCMVDLLGRAGRLDEAHDLIKGMPLEPNASVWGSLLAACRNYHNVELAEHVAGCLLNLQPENAGNYVLLSNIYATAGRWDDAAKMRKVMKDKGLKKSPGCSWIEHNNQVHAFVVGDGSHPQIVKIYSMLESLARRMEAAGYVPDTNFVLHNVGDDEKEYILCGHSEKLAVAFGLINTCPGTAIRIFKNLRACGDCHTATKFISKICEREIIVRDAYRFHHFKDGLCSCGDYW